MSRDGDNLNVVEKITRLDGKRFAEQTEFPRPGWVLHIAKVAYFFSSSLPNVEWAILGPLPFFFY